MEKKEKTIYLVSPENAGNTALVWTCQCGTHRVNFPYVSCHKCGDEAPSREVRDSGGKVY